MAMAQEKDEQTFAQMWMEAQTRFHKITNISLAQADKRSVDEVLRFLDERSNKQEVKEDAKRQRVKAFAVTLLKSIQLLAGIAAQGVSIVFGPANLCFNALYFLLEIPAKISKFYDDLERLFKEISTFFRQFKIYQRIEQFTKIDFELKQSSHNLMIAFVDICALSIEIFSGSKLSKIRIGAKIGLFDDDSGVNAKLEEFKMLINHQSQISGAITLEHVLKSEHELEGSMKNLFETLKKASEDSRMRSQATHDDVKVIKQLLNDRSSKDMQDDLFKEICRKLSVHAEKVEEWQKDFDQMRRGSLDDTGSWLTSLEEYQNWIDLKSEVTSPLLLRGDNNSGKSKLAFAILNEFHNQQSKAGGSSMRTPWAFHRFRNKDKATKDGTLSDSLKSIAAQLAHKNPAYLKNLHSHLKSKDLLFSRDTNVQDLFKELIPPPNLKETRDISYVLLFDGLDQLNDDDANKLFGAILARKSSNVRILVTGTEEIFDSCLKFVGQSLDSVLGIRVVDYNQPDIVRFVDWCLKDYKALQENAPPIRRIAASIQENLPNVVNGNFEQVKQILEKINEAIENEESEVEVINLISRDSLERKPVVTEKLINELNDSLNPREIEQLNEILMWTIYAMEYISVEEMRAALFLRTKRPLLESLEDKVARKYSKLLEIGEDGIITMRDDDLVKFFQESKPYRQDLDTEGNDDPKISMTITIDHVKRSKLQRFFWDLSEKMIFDRFEFKNSLAEPGQIVRISSNATEACLALTKTCFELLLEEPIEQTKTLIPYALRNLPWHLYDLSEAAGDTSLRSADKEEVVSNLISLLESADCVERNLTREFFEEKCWLDETNGLAAGIQALFRDSEATAKLTRKQRQWLERANSGGGFLALKNIAKMVARHWLWHRTWSAELPFEWIDVYLDRSVGDQVANTKEVMSIRTRVKRAVSWAENEAGITKNSLWYERLGNTYLHYKELDVSREEFLTAKMFPDHSWEISARLAEAYAVGDLPSLAVKEMDVAIQHLREKESITTEETIELVKNLIKSANWHAKLSTSTADVTNKLHEAIREAIRLDEHHYQSHFELLQVLINTEQRSEAINYLEGMTKRLAQNDSLNQLESMLRDFSNWDKPHEYSVTLFNATRHHDMFQTILKPLENALESARKNKATSNAIDLLLSLGVALFYYSSDDTHREYAINLWTECCRLGSKISKKWYEVFLAATHIFSYYCSQARSTPSVVSDFETRVIKLKELIELMPYYDSARRLRISLGSFYTLSGKQVAAQELLVNDMKNGIDILSDDDPTNDVAGYIMIANILMHTGDDLNALSAWSLIGPGVRYEETGDEKAEDGTESSLPAQKTSPVQEDWASGYYCDGLCDKPMTVADSIWCCKMCSNVQLHGECREKLRKGTLTHFVCSPEHDWLRVPLLIDEFQATGKGRVRVEGELQDGKRVGGRIVTVEEWLNTIKVTWGITSPLPEAQIESDSREEAEEAGEA